MNVSLTKELELFVHGRVATGRYHSASEVVREGLRMLESREQLRELQMDEVRRHAMAPAELGREFAGRNYAARESLRRDYVDRDYSDRDRVDQQLHDPPPRAATVIPSTALEPSEPGAAQSAIGAGTPLA